MGIHSELLLLLHALWRFLQFSEELRVENVAPFLFRLWNHIILQKAEVEKDEDIVEIDTWLEEFEIFFCHFHSPI